MYKQNLLLAIFGLVCLSSCAWAGYIPHAPAYPSSYAAPLYSIPDTAEAAASAITDIAAAKASAAKINHINRAALDNYGHQIGVPLLVKNYGPLTSLYSALAPKRSFVGTIDAGFYKDHYGKIKFSDELAIGAIAV